MYLSYLESRSPTASFFKCDFRTETFVERLARFGVYLVLLIADAPITDNSCRLQGGKQSLISATSGRTYLLLQTWTSRGIDIPTHFAAWRNLLKLLI